MDRPIPAFYCCYLLRSTIRHQNLYVGSTPDPVRRLKQHNGIARGGAVRTSRDSLRPWEMTCLVMGFPSKIAALQFEWAWQNTHLTRHIAPDTRITQAQMRQRYSPKTGKVRKKVGRPRMCLTDRLANLHILLRSPSFERWPLKVTFFAHDVFKMWQRVRFEEHIRPGVSIACDSSAVIATKDTSHECTTVDTGLPTPTGIQALDVTYQPIKASIEKSKALLSIATRSCAVCQHALGHGASLCLVCPEEGCQATSHLTCLSKAFLKESNDSDAIVPTDGKCPTCKATLSWAELVRELSLRIRGDKEVAALFKEPRRKKATAPTAAAVLTAPEDVLVEDEDDLDEELEDDLDDEVFKRIDDFASSQPLPSSQDSDWRCIDIDGPRSPAQRQVQACAAVSSAADKIVEDSDWDSADVLD